MAPQRRPRTSGGRSSTYFDIVGFDPRGTGESSPVDCLSDDGLDAYLAGDPEPDDPRRGAGLPPDGAQHGPRL